MERYTIGEVAERTGLSVHALRLYEREGLMLHPIEREAGRRLYSEDDVEWIELCLFLRRSNMPLKAVRRYAELVRAGDGTEPERLALLRRHRAAVEAQMRALHDSLDLISHKVGIYEGIVGDGVHRHAGGGTRTPTGYQPTGT